MFPSFNVDPVPITSPVAKTMSVAVGAAQMDTIGA